MNDNADQAAFWGGDAGDKWVRHQAMLDHQMQPVLDGVLSRAGLAAGLRVLDVGCGTGQSSLQAAELVGPGGHVLGADVSAPMLDLARNRAEGSPQVSFLQADVAVHGFDAASFDQVISRFGVMFFADPVMAFANIARAMKPGAQLTFASWGAIERNPWFTLPARVARAEIGVPPKSDPDAPGPFAFRDIAKVENILRAAGLREVRGEAVDMDLTLPGGAADLAHLTSYIGSAASVLAHFEADEAARAALELKLKDAFAALPDEAVPAEINYFTATR